MRGSDSTDWRPALLTLLLALSPLGAAADGVPPVPLTPGDGTTGYAQERFKQAPGYSGPPRSGEAVYEYRCKTCHDRTTQGAPLPDDSYEWGRRVRQGLPVLMDHVINGYRSGLMPARGGCLNCSDAELRGAVLYMLERSGVAPEATPARPSSAS